MKQRNLMVLTLSCALLIIIELGVSIIYSDYIYNPCERSNFNQCCQSNL